MSKFEQDENLLKRLANGDEGLYKKLFYDYRAPFKRFFLLGNKLTEEEAEEKYVESYTAFWHNIQTGRLSPPLKSSLLTYIIGIGNNYAKRLFEKKSRDREREKLSEDLEKDTSYAVNSPEILDFFECQERSRLVEQLLSKLDESCRELLLYSFVKEYADESIAEEMNIPTALAVRQKRFRCLEKLRKFYRDNG